jgi:hypothetical protein
MQRTTEAALQPRNRLVGSWVTAATHPAVPGVVQGTASIEWLEGQRSDPPLAQRSSGLPRCHLDHRVHRRGSCRPARRDDTHWNDDLQIVYRRQ